jgi:hypothetical protein
MEPMPIRERWLSSDGYVPLFSAGGRSSLMKDVLVNPAHCKKNVLVSPAHCHKKNVLVSLAHCEKENMPVSPAHREIIPVVAHPNEKKTLQRNSL